MRRNRQRERAYPRIPIETKDKLSHEDIDLD